MAGSSFDPETLPEVFARGFSAGGRPFRPAAFFLRVEEPEFGCEGSPDGREWTGTVRGYDAGGPRVWRLTQSELWHSGFDDGMWLGTVSGPDGAPLRCTVRAGEDVLSPVRPGPWLFQFFGEN